jgi:hypothetical protein
VLGPPIGAWIIVLAAAGAWRWNGRAAAIRKAVAAVLAAGLAATLAATLPASVIGTRFPAVAVAWLTAALVGLVPAIGADHLRGAIRVAGVGVGLLVVTALAELVAGDATLSGVVGGVGVGGLVAAGGELTARTVASPALRGPPPASA